MPATSSSIVGVRAVWGCIALLCCIVSCGPVAIGVALGSSGGGGGETTPVYAFEPYLTQPSVVPGQLLTADVTDRNKLSLVPQTTYPATWTSSSGGEVRLVPARAVTSWRLTLVVPIDLPPGPYYVELPVPGGVGRILVAVGAAPAVGDAATYVDGALDDLEAKRTSLLAAANVDPDLARRARSLADLQRLADWLAAFRGGFDLMVQAGATGQPGLQYLSALLAANADLRAAVPAVQYASLDVVGSRCAGASRRAELGMAALVVAGVVTAPPGGMAVLQPMAAGTFLLGGLAASLEALGGWQAALALPFRPIPGEPLALRTEPYQEVRVTTWVPSPLRCRAVVSSLAAVDRAGAAGVVSEIFAALDRYGGMRGELDASIRALLESLPPDVPPTPITALTELDPSRLELLSQDNPTFQLSIAGGSLRVDGTQASGMVGATFRYQEGSMGMVTSTTTVQVFDVPAGLDMVRIQAGSFLMGGSGVGQPGEGYSLPIHQVTLSRNFWIGKYEVSQSQFLQVLATNPSHWTGSTRPVEQVTWSLARDYCSFLNLQEIAAGRVPAGYEYRLPTEAEWEYCCRAGTTTDWSVGTALSCALANYKNSPGTGGPACVGQPVVVQSYQPNPWGLHQMHGNVWEWCLDNWDFQNYPSSPVVDPLNTIGTGEKILRGGGYFTGDDGCKSAFRGHKDPSIAFDDFGFRIVLAPIRTLP